MQLLQSNNQLSISKIHKHNIINSYCQSILILEAMLNIQILMQKIDFDESQQGIRRRALQYLVSNNSMAILSRDLEEQFIPVFISIIENPSQDLNFKLRAAHKIYQQIKDRNDHIFTNGKVWVSKLIFFLITCDNKNLRKNSQNIVQHLIRNNLDVMTCLKAGLQQILQKSASASRLFSVFLPIFKGCSTHSNRIAFKYHRRLINMIHHKVLHAFIKIYKEDETLQNLYFFTKICRKIYDLRIFDEDNYGESTMIFPIIFKAAFSSNPAYDMHQLVECLDKDTALFFYSHSKKWAFRSIAQFSAIYCLQGYFSKNYQNKQKQNHSKSWSDLWLSPYMHRLILQLPQIAPVQILSLKLDLLCVLYRDYFFLIEPYLEILMKEILPSFFTQPAVEDIKSYSASNLWDTSSFKHINQIKDMWQLLLQKITQQKLHLTVDECIDFTEDLLLSNQDEGIYKGLELLSCIFQAEQCLCEDNVSKVQSIIDGIFSQLISNESDILQNKVFLMVTIYRYLIKVKRQKLRMSSCGIFHKFYKEFFFNKDSTMQKNVSTLLSIAYDCRSVNKTFQVDGEALITYLFENTYIEYSQQIRYIHNSLKKIDLSPTSRTFYLLKVIQLYKSKNDVNLIDWITLIIYQRQSVNAAQQQQITDILLTTLYNQKKVWNTQKYEKDYFHLLQMALFDKISTIPIFYLSFFDRIDEYNIEINEPYTNNQFDLMEKIQFEKIEFVNYAFFIKYLKRGALIFKSEQELRKHIFKPIFNIIHRQFVKVSLADAILKQFCTLSLLSILIQLYQNSLILQDYYQNIERIILKAIKNKNVCTKKTKIHVYRATARLITAYLSVNLRIAVQSNSFLEMAAYLIEHILQFKDKLSSQQIQQIFPYLSRLMKAEIYQIKVSNGNIVHMIEPIFQLLLQISSHLKPKQQYNPEIKQNKSQIRSIYTLKQTLQQHNSKKMKNDMSLIDFQAAAEFVSMKQNIMSIMRNQNQQLNIIAQKFTQIEMGKIKQMLKINIK